MEAFSQQTPISIITIRQKIDEAGDYITKARIFDKMYMITDNKGYRWIYVEDNEINGYPSDEKQLLKRMSKKIFELVAGSINYSLEVPYSYMGLVNLFKSKNFVGVEFKTKNRIFHLYWNDILKQ